MEGETREEEQEGTAQEGCTVSGAVEAVSQKENRYAVLIAGDWYGGWGACPVSKGQVCVVDYVNRGRFRNVVRLREVGDALSLSAAGQRPRIPAAVKNYSTPEGWEQAFLTEEEERLIQDEVRARNAALVGECLTDAKDLLEMCPVQRAATPKNTLELAMFLAERRVVHISRVLDQFMTAKVAAVRNGPPLAPSTLRGIGDGAEARALLNRCEGIDVDENAR